MTFSSSHPLLFSPSSLQAAVQAGGLREGTRGETCRLLHKLPFWSYFCKAGDGTTRKLGAKAALVALAEAEAQLDSEKRILDENVQLCSIFELDIIEAESKVGFIFTYAWGHRLFKLESNSEQAHNGDVSESGSF